MKKTYQHAIECLNSLQSNAATIAASTSAREARRGHTLRDMEVYLRRMGYTPSDLNRLNVLHITGTKGKGSTAAFVSSLLQSLNPDASVGLYTSPHLVAVRERIRINGHPLSEERFAKYFFDVWMALDGVGEGEVSDVDSVNNTHSTSTLPKPAYFRFMTLVAFHTFLAEDVDATVLEVGIGGSLDCTNIVPAPAVAAVSSLGLDHTALLGGTIRAIALNKGGIYKAGAAALTVPQPEDGEAVLAECAQRVNAPFGVVDTRDAPANHTLSLPLGLPGVHQALNARLAVDVVRAFVNAGKSNKFASWKGELEGHDWRNGLPQVFVDGLTKARWPGRCQTVVDPRRPSTTWFLDGSHTADSLTACMQWFGGVVRARRERELEVEQPQQHTRTHLIFNCTKGRSPTELLGVVAAYLTAAGANMETLFTSVIFCTNLTYTSGEFASDLTARNVDVLTIQELEVQHELKAAWNSLLPQFKGCVEVLPSIEAAVDYIDRSESLSVNSTNNPHSHTHILVCGSLHLVGGVIEVARLADVAL
ncbi:hypothetical protein E3P92_01536 [Wallemia ichthyophaga]|nr:hypothetical protein E3P91_01373 [Wallemia ichthyophaga]TIB15798.1 hypothetical protein E3P92_01536 [Wallemia ichthyophaga]TIB64125.1 hypothetical protein E3P78_01394 [Wallemia ichthyophaga]